MYGVQKLLSEKRKGMGANKEGGMEFKDNKKRIKDKDYCTVRRTPCSSLRGLSGKLQAADWLLLFTPTVQTVTESILFKVRLRQKAGFLAVLCSWHIA